jgi:hypothetical protein
VASLTFNAALGRVAHYASVVEAGTDEALVVVALRAAEPDESLRDHATLDALLAAAGNTEANFSNYERFEVGPDDVTVSVDNGADIATVTIPDVLTWVDAGDPTYGEVVVVLVCFDPDPTTSDDTDRLPLTLHNYLAETDGGDLTLQFPGGVFWRGQST